jgi:hypothetical protein
MGITARFRNFLNNIALNEGQVKAGGAAGSTLSAAKPPSSSTRPGKSSGPLLSSAA